MTESERLEYNRTMVAKVLSLERPLQVYKTTETPSVPPSDAHEQQNDELTK